MDEQAMEWQYNMDNFDSDMKRMGRFKGSNDRDFTEELEYTEKIMRWRNKIMLGCIAAAIVLFIIVLAKYISVAKSVSNDHRLYDSANFRYSVGTTYHTIDSKNWISYYSGYLILVASGKVSVNKCLKKLGKLDVLTEHSYELSSVYSGIIYQEGKLVFATNNTSQLSTIEINIEEQNIDLKNGDPIELSNNHRPLVGLAFLPTEDNSDDKKYTMLASDKSNVLRKISLDLEQGSTQEISKIELSHPDFATIQLGPLVVADDYILAILLNSTVILVIDLDSAKIERYLDVKPILPMTHQKDNNGEASNFDNLYSIAYDSTSGSLFISGENGTSIIELIMIKTQFKKK